MKVFFRCLGYGVAALATLVGLAWLQSILGPAPSFGAVLAWLTRVGLVGLLLGAVVALTRRRWALAGGLAATLVLALVTTLWLFTVRCTK